MGLLFLMGVGLAASPAGAVGFDDLGAIFGPLMQESPMTPDVVPDVDIDVHRSEERVVWFANPLLIGAGVVVLIVVVVALIARGGSGGGTTIVKD
jgi:hypothetical protein